jgi:HD-like signal output (HDOD) protein
VSVSCSSLPVRERALLALHALPPLSPVLHRVIASLAHEDVSFAKVAELIEKDIALAGNILQLVNSPLYSTRGTVSSVRHAIAILGVNKLRNTVLGVSAAQMWRSLRTPPGWLMADFNHHSVSVAILADLLSQRLRVQDAAGAFAAGLFHDLGLLLIITGLPAEYHQISLLCEMDPQRSLEHELQVLGTTHADLSAEALAIWNLPAPIRAAVRYHVRPELDPKASQGDGIALSRVLHAANAYVGSRSVSFCVMEDYRRGKDSSLESLGLGDQVSGVLSEFENELAAIQPYF